MRLAAIVPPGCADLIPEEYYAMAFADIAFRNPSYVREYILRPHVIMDNQIYEGNRGLDIDDEIFIIGLMQPEVVIVPDVRQDFAETRARAEAYVPRMRALLPKHVNLCGVVQGQTSADIIECARYWASSAVEWVSTPIKPNATMSREYVYRMVASRLGSKRIHWLGLEDYNGVMPPEVQTCDTAEPTTATILGVDMALGFTPADVQRLPNFLSWPGYATILRERKELFWSNLAWVQSKLNHNVDQPATSEESPATDTSPTV